MYPDDYDILFDGRQELLPPRTSKGGGLPDYSMTLHSDVDVRAVQRQEREAEKARLYNLRVKAQLIP